MSTKLDTKLDDASIAEWPPLAHIIHEHQKPAQEGTIALCGAKLMGLDLPNDTKTLCKKCIKIADTLNNS